MGGGRMGFGGLKELLSIGAREEGRGADVALESKTAVPDKTAFTSKGDICRGKRGEFPNVGAGRRGVLFSIGASRGFRGIEKRKRV